VRGRLPDARAGLVAVFCDVAPRLVVRFDTRPSQRLYRPVFSAALERDAFQFDGVVTTPFEVVRRMFA
jgi:hypothetical protein